MPPHLLPPATFSAFLSPSGRVRGSTCDEPAALAPLDVCCRTWRGVTATGTAHPPLRHLPAAQRTYTARAMPLASPGVRVLRRLRAARYRLPT